MFKRKKKEKVMPIKAMILEKGKLTELDMKVDKDGKLEAVKHDDKILTPDDKKFFVERNWRGRIKQKYQIFDLTTVPLSLEAVGMIAFDPTKTISAEEADLRIHEEITAAATSSIVMKIKGVAVSKKWLFVVMGIVIAIAAAGYLLHMKGVF